MKARYLDEQEHRIDCQSFGNPFYPIILRSSRGLPVQQHPQIFCTFTPYVSDACMFKLLKGEFRKATHCQTSLRIHLI